MQTGYHLLVIIIGILSIRYGWSRGFMRFVPSVLGFAFGIICANIFGFPARAYVALAMPWLKNVWWGEFAIQNIAASGIFVIIFLLFKSLTSLFRHAFSLMSTGVLNSIFGVAAALLIWITFTSMALNMVLCFDPESALLKYAGDSDGNIAGVTLLLAPDLMGCMDAAQLSHIHQMREARNISCNFCGLEPLCNMDYAHLTLEVGQKDTSLLIC